MDNQEEKNIRPEEPAPRKNTSHAGQTALSYLHDLVFLLAGVVLVFVLLFRIMVVSGGSMKNTLRNGDYLLVLNNVFYRNPQPGDIIVATKDSFKNGEPIIKRVIATEGQWVDIDFQAGIVYVDHQPMDEPYVNTPTNYAEGMQFPLIVQEGCLFVMGDNRNSSKDSRDPEIGLIDKREVLGKAVFLIFPGFNDMKQREINRIGVIG